MTIRASVQFPSLRCGSPPSAQVAPEGRCASTTKALDDVARYGRSRAESAHPAPPPAVRVASRTQLLCRSHCTLALCGLGPVGHGSRIGFLPPSLTGSSGARPESVGSPTLRPLFSDWGCFVAARREQGSGPWGPEPSSLLAAFAPRSGGALRLVSRPGLQRESLRPQIDLRP